MANPDPIPRSAWPAYPAANGQPAGPPASVMPGQVPGQYSAPGAELPMAAYPVPIATSPGQARPVPIAARPTASAAIAHPLPAGYAAPGVSVAQPRAAARPVLVSPGPLTVRDRSPEEQAEETEDKPPPVVRNAPPWLISTVIHVLILIVMALIFIRQKAEPVVEIITTYAETEGEQLINETLDFGLDDEQFDEAILTPEDLQPVENPLAAPPDLELQAEATSSMSEFAAPNIGLALTGREAGTKNALLAAYGGNATTEAAVKLGLAWLKRNQKKDGSWSLEGPYKDGGESENHVAATAMAILAFQGAGHTPAEGEHKEVVAKAWNWLLKQQDNDGAFLPQGAPDHHRLYTHAQATIALCELYGMTKDSKYLDAAQKAINYCVSAQDAEGGWRYHPKQGSDTSVTGWYVMALQSAMMAGLKVPEETLANVNKFLDSVAVDGGRRYSYQPNKFETMALNAEGLLCRQYLGWKHDDKRLMDGVANVVANPVDYARQNVYYWYYATQAAHHMEGDLWDRWNRVMRQKVPEAQTKSGPEEGSWDPASDEWGSRGAGRLYTTCLSIYMLEVYYRHLPIYAQLYRYKLQQF